GPKFRATGLSPAAYSTCPEERASPSVPTMVQSLPTSITVDIFTPSSRSTHQGRAPAVHSLLSSLTKHSLATPCTILCAKQTLPEIHSPTFSSTIHLRRLSSKVLACGRPVW